MSDLPIKFLSELMPVASSGVGRDEIIKHFTESIKNSFNVDKASISDVARTDSQATLVGYIAGTKKPYVDNQLSDYSSFPELLIYKNEGYRSYAALPIMADGRVVSLLEMLSVSDSKFTQEIVDNISMGVLLVGFAIAYKSELGRSNRLAEYFDAVFDSSNPQMLVSSNGSILKANKSAMKEFGISSIGSSDVASSLGIGVDKLLKIAASRNAALTKLKNSGKTYSIFANKISDSLISVSVSDSTDVSNLRAALQSISHSDDVFIVFTDEGLKMIGITDNFDSVLGYEKNIMMGKRITDIVSPKDREQLLSEIDSMSGSTTEKIKKIDLVSMNGYSIRSHFSVSRSLTGYSFMFARADAEKYVDDLKNWLYDFASNSTDIVLMLDDLGFIKSANMSVEPVLQYNKDELIGKEVKLLYKDQFVLDRDLAFAKKGGKPDNSYIELVGKDSSVVPATHSIRVLTDSDGISSYIVIVKELQTRRKLTDQELEIKERDKTIKRLRSTGDLKSQFIYNISHELKTPLTSIMGFAKLLENGEFGPLNDDQKQYIETVSNESDRLMLIIQQVLDAAKLDANKVKLELKEVDLKSLDSNPSIKALEESAAAKGLSFEWKVDYDVPKIIADPNRLIQIFVNLIGNSIKFTDKGGIKVFIKKRNKRKIECSVIDTGIGISDDDKQKLFKKFYQVPKNATKDLIKQDGSGTGLGLSITKELVKLHGGDIDFESQLGKGSRFWFTLKANPRSRKGGQVQQSS